MSVAWWVVWALLTLLALARGCFTPPAILEASDPEWRLERSPYPLSTELVEVPLPGGEVLRGVFVPSDPGAPVVVHFPGSGVSTTAGLAPSLQYEALAEAGYASLAVDYRGTGRSDGDRDADQLVEDALAIWGAARARVQGDPARLVLRGTSLGCLAVGAILRGGARPAGVVLYAPVLGDTVAERYGADWLTPSIAWLVSTFLKPVTDVDLPAVLEARADVPMLVFVSATDELLSAEERAHLVALVEAGGGQAVVHGEGGGSTVAFGGLAGAGWSGLVPEHVALASLAFDLTRPERVWLGGILPGRPDVAHRWTRLAAALDAQTPGVLGEHPALEGRLRGLLRRHDLDPPGALVAACLAGGDAPGAAALLDGEVVSLPPASRILPSLTAAGADQEVLAALFSLDDPGGPLDGERIADLRRLFEFCHDPYGAPFSSVWSAREARALAEQAHGVHDGSALSVVPDGEEPEAGTLWLDDEGRIFARAVHGEITRTCGFPLDAVMLALTDLFRGIQGGEPSRDPPADRLRRLTREVLKAMGHPDRVVPLPDGGWGLEVWDLEAAEPGWRPLPLVRLDEEGRRLDPSEPAEP